MDTKSSINETVVPANTGALGDALNIREVSRFLGFSPWTVRHALIPQGLPHFRSGASGKLIFYRDQVVAWICTQQQGGNHKP